MLLGDIWHLKHWALSLSYSLGETLDQASNEMQSVSRSFTLLPVDFQHRLQNTMRILPVV